MKGISILLAGLALAPLAMAAGPTEPAPRVASPEDLPAYWRPASEPAPVPYPVDLASRGVTGCLTLAYVIEPDGSTADFRTLDASASSRSPVAKRQAIEAFARAAAAAVSTWRYTPVGEPQRTVTATSVEFNPNPAASSGHCDAARALAKGNRWDGMLRDLYESRWRLNAGQLNRPTR
jgi:outer membrane biosynthesis protein TonB